MAALAASNNPMPFNLNGMILPNSNLMNPYLINGSFPTPNQFGTPIQPPNYYNYMTAAQTSNYSFYNDNIYSAAAYQMNGMAAPVSGMAAFYQQFHQQQPAQVPPVISPQVQAANAMNAAMNSAMNNASYYNNGYM